MQLERGDRSGALDSADKIAESLKKESEGARLADKVADVRSRGGGAANADFDSLMDLIKEVIEPDSWDDVGGPGSMEPFPLGVSVDAAGVLRRQMTDGGKDSSRLGQLQRELAENPGGALRSAVYKPEKPAGLADEFKDLRMVSLVRLEQAARHFYEAGLPLPDEVRYLGGIQRIRYVFALPESHDIVLAGYPLGTLAPSEAGDELAGLRTQARRDTAGTPVLQLDDFVVLLRSCLAGTGGQTFGCTIEPSPEGLARVKEFSAKPRESASRRRWVEQIREKLGRQDIRIWGVPANSRVGSIMVAADYRMKLIGIGLEEGPRGIPSYLDLLESHSRGAPPPLETLRWWFTPRYEEIVASPEHLAFELRGEAVQLLSENQYLLANGQRQRTGAAEPINELFARNFTEFYGDLADTEPLFAELRNVFDLAVVAALITKEGLAREVGWDMSFFAEGGGYTVESVDVPQSVESVVNYRVINGRHVVVAVSGGVTIDPHRAASPEKQEQDAALTGIADRTAASTAPDHWWWRPKQSAH